MMLCGIHEAMEEAGESDVEELFHLLELYRDILVSARCHWAGS